MGRSVYFFCTAADNQLLSEEAIRVGLRMYPILMSQEEIQTSDDPIDGPFCYLSVVPRSETHPYGDPPIIGPATDPLLDSMRAYYKPPTLVMGRIYWSDDVPELAKITKPYFLKLFKWIKKQWHRNADGQYMGWEAKKLHDSGQAQLAYLVLKPRE